MKIRFGKNQVVDTNLVLSDQMANLDEQAGKTELTYDALDDAGASYEDQTQLNLMKRLAKGFLAYLKGGSWTDNYLKQAVVKEFADLANDSGVVPWADLEDAMVYDDKAEEAGE